MSAPLQAPEQNDIVREGALLVGAVVAAATLAMTLAVIAQYYWEVALPPSLTVMGAHYWMTARDLANVQRLARSSTFRRPRGLVRLRRLARLQRTILALLFVTGVGMYAHLDLIEQGVLVVLPALSTAFGIARLGAARTIGSIARTEGLDERASDLTPSSPSSSCRRFCVLALLSSLILVVGAGWSVGAERLGLQTPSDFRDAILPGSDEASPSAAREDSSTADRGVDTTVAPGGSPTPEANATETPSCTGTNFRMFSLIPNPPAEEAIVEAWGTIGSTEIGCPAGPALRKRDLFMVPLREGESNPSLVFGDSAGRAAVVFEDLVPLATRLWAHGDLEYVAARTSTGRRHGDFQLFHLRRGRCMYVDRVFGRGYVALPPAATTVVLAEAAGTGLFPVLLESRERRGHTEVLIQLTDGVVRQSIEVVIEPDGSSWLKDSPGSVVDPREATCANETFLYEVAGVLHSRFD